MTEESHIRTQWRLRTKWLLGLVLLLALAGPNAAPVQAQWPGTAGFDGPGTNDRDPWGAPQSQANSGLPAAPYTIDALTHARITQAGQTLTGALDFHDGPFANVTVVLELESPCFPFERWADDPPPPGQNWPTDCDAFDRNVELTIDPPPAMDDPPGLEIVHAITPFGGPLTLEHDVTDLVNGLGGGPHTFSVFIPTYSDPAGRITGSNGQWFVSLRFEVTPGPAPRTVLAVIPLLNVNHGPATSPYDIPFDVPDGTMDSRIEYRTSGHGGGAPGVGCIGPAEEFCRREHQVFIDGNALERLDAWRTDCADLCTVATYTGPPPFPSGFRYCAENPTGAMASVRAPRANWCPGSETPPSVWSFDALAVPGQHTFNYAISTVLPGGSWRVSAIYYAYGDVP